MHIKKDEDSDDFKFTYKLKKGISKIKGGLKVLKDLDYPEHIIKTIENDRKQQIYTYYFIKIDIKVK